MRDSQHPAKELAEDISNRKGGSTILPILFELDRSVRKYRELWPNLDFYSAAILHDLGVATNLFTPMLLGVALWAGAHTLRSRSAITD
ncbi:citrate/2-methylcitrate synthase [Ensifer aridi]|uniref:citrate/2-methylcitrate synthase n=1 Tax=Ensifer aridi TaxID=1708715 RepID=UPI00111C124D